MTLTPDFDPALLSPARLRICVALHAARATAGGAVDREMKFSRLAVAAGLDEPSLSEFLADLQHRGYLSCSHTRGRSGRREQTWVMLTVAGVNAVTGHVSALRARAGAGEPPAEPGG